MSHVFLPRPRCPYVARVLPETEVSLCRTCSSRDRCVLMTLVFGIHHVILRLFDCIKSVCFICIF